MRGEPKSERVEALQKKLRAAGLGRVAEDGMYGDQTHAAFCRALLRSRDCDIADGDWEKIDLALDAPPRRRRRRS